MANSIREFYLSLGNYREKNGLMKIGKLKKRPYWECKLCKKRIVKSLDPLRDDINLIEHYLLRHK